jgi:hypothetical protein
MAEEFGLGVDTIRRALLACGHEPGRTSRFTVREVFDAVSGAGLLKTSKARESAARAEMLELEASEIRKELMRRDAVEQFLVNHLRPLRESLDAFAATNPQHREWVDGIVRMMGGAR